MDVWYVFYWHFLQYLTYIDAARFIHWWLEYLEKTTNFPKFTEKRYHAILNRVHLSMGGIQTHNVSGDGYILHR
jgi:hypothetical protein